MWIPISRIYVNEQRLNEEKLDDFVEDIGRGRKMKPVTVRKLIPEHVERFGFNYGLIDGHHRLAAYKILGKETIQVVVTL